MTSKLRKLLPLFQITAVSCFHFSHTCHNLSAYFYSIQYWVASASIKRLNLYMKIQNLHSFLHLISKQFTLRLFYWVHSILPELELRVKPPKLSTFAICKYPYKQKKPLVKRIFPLSKDSSKFILYYSSAIAYCTIIGSSYSAHIDLFSSNDLSFSISESVNSKSKISIFCFIRSLCKLFGITTIPR